MPASGAGSRQRHRTSGTVLRALFVLLADVPVTYAVAAGALREIHMDMVLVIAVGARPQHGRKARAGPRPQILAKVFWHMRIGELDHRAAPELDGADVQCVGLAVLGELRSRNPVAPAAIIRGVIVDALERAMEGARGRRYVVAHPLHDCFGKGATKDRGRRDSDAALARQYDSFEPHQIAGPAFPGALDGGYRGSQSKVVRQSPPAVGGRLRFDRRCGLRRGYTRGRAWPRQWRDLPKCHVARRYQNGENREQLRR